MNGYLELIGMAQTLNQLDEIVETAANDELLTDCEYCDIYGASLKRAQSF